MGQSLHAIRWVTLFGVLGAVFGLLTDVFMIRLLQVGDETDAVLVANTLPLLIQSMMIATYQPAAVVHLTKHPQHIAALTQRIRRYARRLTGLLVVLAPLTTLIAAPGLQQFGLGAALSAALHFTIYPLMLAEHRRAQLHIKQNFVAAAGILLLANIVGSLAIFSIWQVGVVGVVISRYARALVLWGLTLALTRSEAGMPHNGEPLSDFWSDVTGTSIGYLSLQFPWLLARILISFSGVGFITALDLAWRWLNQVTYLFVLVPVTVALPTLSAIQTTRLQISQLLRQTLGLAVLAAVSLVVMAFPAMTILYGFAPRLSLALMILSPAIIGMSLTRLVQHVHFANRHHRGIHRLAAAMLILGVVLAPFGSAGVGIALSVTAILALRTLPT